MATKKFTLSSFIKNSKPASKRKKKKSKSPKAKKTVYKKGGLANSWYVSDVSGSDGADGGGIGEGLMLELFADMKPFTVNQQQGMSNYPSEDPEAVEEEPEMKASKVDQARQLFQAMFNRPDASRNEIINSFMNDVGVTNSTAVSYYTRFLDEFGVKSKEEHVDLGQGVSMGSEDMPSQGQSTEEPPAAVPTMDGEEDDSGDPNRSGIIRTVNNAHLVYKRQSETGTFEELWIYNIHDKMHDDLDVHLLLCHRQA